jgi:hypothetical protein
MLLKYSTTAKCDQQQLNRSTFIPRARVACSSYLRNRSNKSNGIYPAPGVQSTSSSSWRLASPVPHNRAASTDTMVTPETPASNQLQQTDVLIVGGMIAGIALSQVTVSSGALGFLQGGVDHA